MKYKNIDLKMKSKLEQEILLKNENENEKIIITNLFLEESKSSSIDFNSDEYINKVILFGYIMLFGSAMWLGPLIFLLINSVDMRVDAQRLLWLFRRPIGYKAKNIGIFKD
jgi:anoctamin-1